MLHVSLVCTINTAHIHRNPELIILGEFVRILSLSDGTIRRKLTEICHSFHRDCLQGMWDEGTNTLNLKGKIKSFRIAEIHYCSYLIEDASQCRDWSTWKWIYQEKPNALKNIKLLYFGTNPTTYSIYGPLQFRTPYDVAIKLYLQARNRQRKTEVEYKSVVFRVGYTQIFRYEVNKVVIACCEGDDNLDIFPKLGPEHCSKHFTPNSDGSAWVELELYGTGRHDEISLAFNLPNGYLTFHLLIDGFIFGVNHDPFRCHEPLKTPYFKGNCSAI